MADTMIPEFSGFDPSQHVYVVVTGCGDVWETPGPLATALQNDMAQAEYTGPLEGWVNELAVWGGDKRVAVWRDGRWRVLHSPSASISPSTAGR